MHFVKCGKSMVVMLFKSVLLAREAYKNIYRLDDVNLGFPLQYCFRKLEKARE